ncbi:MAG TPA: hypothetical protein VEA38_15095 [Terriglobales bacterium]|nr:hypothetical protein [Terriglobales bacterium]
MTTRPMWQEPWDAKPVWEEDWEPVGPRVAYPPPHSGCWEPMPHWAGGRLTKRAQLAAFAPEMARVLLAVRDSLGEGDRMIVDAVLLKAGVKP